jgi:multiple sugar transport system substrate-binding protein
MSPLRASVADYQRYVPDIDISWDTRSLSDFGDGRLEELLGFDLIIFDHPYCGQIAAEKWLINFADLLDVEEQDAHASDSLGLCWESYHADGRIWGLPIDAAAQVASYRPDLMTRLEADIPRNLGQVIDLGNRARKQGMYIGFPAVSIDVMCTFLTLCANAGMPVSRDKTFFPERGDTIAVLRIMKTLLELAHPESASWDPIRAYEHMSTADDVVYIPYAFGYTNYSRDEQRKPIRFCNIPSMQGDNCSGAILGGAGIGVSTNSRNADAAARYARFLCSPEYQSGAYFKHGGQPASRAAWTCEANDQQCLGFFSSTIETMQQAYLRPTYDSYVNHFRRAESRILAALRGQDSLTSVADWLRDDYFS